MKNKKKYLSFDDLRIAYDPKDDTIKITSGDPVLKKMGFNVALNPYTPLEEKLRRLLEQEGLVQPDTAAIPEKALFEDAKPTAWNHIPLGVGKNGKQIEWAVDENPHMLIAGRTGTGKSRLQSTILQHLQQHADKWRVIGVDMKRVEFEARDLSPELLMVTATDIEESLEVIRFAYEIMLGRLYAMRTAKVNHFTKIEDPDRFGEAPYALMVMVDEAASLLTPREGGGETAAEENAMKQEMQNALSEVARLGRAAGVFLNLATQSPSAVVIPGQLRNNLDVRVATGHLDATLSSIVLDSSAATRTPATIKGRAIIRQNGHVEPFQVYYSTL